MDCGCGDRLGIGMSVYEAHGPEILTYIVLGVVFSMVFVFSIPRYALRSEPWLGTVMVFTLTLMIMAFSSMSAFLR